jgi:aminoglycoside 3-N-acetyltransferase
MRQVARRLQFFNNRVFRRIARDEIREALLRLGLAPGDTVYANVSMRSLGYVRDGPAAVIAAILDVVGETGTLMMPAWSCADLSHLDLGAVFDLVETPAGTGLLSETLRRYPGSRRSLHPVASVVAVGGRAEELTSGHERSATPFGADSPYGRLALKASKLLLLGTQMGGILYHVLERVGFPNLYNREPVEFDVRDGSGKYDRIRSLLPRPGIPSVVILPGRRPQNRDYLPVQDYALIFPPDRERDLMEAGYLRFNRSRFLGRRQRLLARGILKVGCVGAADAALLDGTRMLEQVVRDLAWDVARCKEEYDPEQISTLNLPVI